MNQSAQTFQAASRQARLVRQDAGVRLKLKREIKLKWGSMEKQGNEVHYVFMTEKEVAAKIGVARSTLRRWSKDGTFPEAVELGPRLRRWTTETVDGWLRSRVEKQTA